MTPLWMYPFIGFGIAYVAVKMIKLLVIGFVKLVDFCDKRGWL